MNLNDPLVIHFITQNSDPNLSPFNYICHLKIKKKKKKLCSIDNYFFFFFDRFDNYLHISY